MYVRREILASISSTQEKHLPIRVLQELRCVIVNEEKTDEKRSNSMALTLFILLWLASSTACLLLGALLTIRRRLTTKEK